MAVAMVTLVCIRCDVQFERRKAQHEASMKRGSAGPFCSKSCVQRTGRKNVIDAACRQCGTSFQRENSSSRELGQFCSLSCCAKWQASRRLGSGKPKVCLDCGSTIQRRTRRCIQCASTYRARAAAEQTLGKLRAEYSISQFHAKVRENARGNYTGKRECAACGYNLHVDICHIRPVADFPAEATLAEVNAPSNLIALDKRCHWEFDHGYLKIVQEVAEIGFEPITERS
jgi:HNH endonuclease